MTVSRWSSVTPLGGSPSLLPLARALLDTMGLGAAVVPSFGDFVPRREWSSTVGDARVSLGVEVYGVDPYGGGASSAEWLRVEAPDRSLRATLSEIAWVGPELNAAAAGTPEWLDAVAAVVAAYVAQHGK